MKIYLLDNKAEMVDCWRKYFIGLDNIEAVCDDFEHFMNTHEVECVVSPANSYGLMDGGYDLAITEYFGEELQEMVKDYILDNLFGEQPIGTSIILDINDKQKLIHTPTMRIPTRIKDKTIIYHCMRSCLMMAIKNNVKSIVIPAFGGGCGEVDCEMIAKMMGRAYQQILNPPKELDWEYASRYSINFRF